MTDLFSLVSKVSTKNGGIDTNHIFLKSRNKSESMVVIVVKKSVPCKFYILILIFVLK